MQEESNNAPQCRTLCISFESFFTILVALCRKAVTPSFHHIFISQFSRGLPRSGLPYSQLLEQLYGILRRACGVLFLAGVGGTTALLAAGGRHLAAGGSAHHPLHHHVPPVVFLVGWNRFAGDSGWMDD